MPMKILDLIIIGGGQSALACSYFLRRTELHYLILDAEEECGAAWCWAWDSLTLFSPAEHSSLPGWMMPQTESQFPSRQEVIDYLCAYEERYKLPVQRPVEVTSLVKEDNTFRLETTAGTYYSRAVISATGTFKAPFIPPVPGRKLFQGQQIHSSEYRSPQPFEGQKVLVVGEGNSGAQILAELSRVSPTRWATRRAPQFLPADVDGRVLFDQASAQYYARQKGEEWDSRNFNLGNIVQVPPVKEALQRNALESDGKLDQLQDKAVVWSDGRVEKFDAIIWCTGFGYATSHLEGLLSRDEQGKVPTEGTRSSEEPGIWLVGYGGWTGFASATLIGVGRSAKKTVQQIEAYLAGEAFPEDPR